MEQKLRGKSRKKVIDEINENREANGANLYSALH